MAKFVAPPNSRRAINRAGARIANNNLANDDVMLVDQWRASHAYVLNTFQIFFKRRVEEFNNEIEFAQRLKRRNTIIDKLQRRSEAGARLVSDVTSMQDFAGCRLIFPTIDVLNDFRVYLHSAHKMKNVKHVLKHAQNPEKYNYIERPKWSGYRGVHEIFIHEPRPHRRGIDVAAAWRGLLCEVQYRTKLQHAWATALEISDFMDGERTKFAIESTNSNPRIEFFRLVSELLARHHENVSNAFINDDTNSLRDKIHTLETELEIMKRLSAMRAAEDFPNLKRHNVLNIIKDSEGIPRLEVFVFNNAPDAIRKSQELESSENSLNAVYVASDRPSELRRAFKNYFSDPVDFVGLVNSAMG